MKHKAWNVGKREKLCWCPMELVPPSTGLQTGMGWEGQWWPGWGRLPQETAGVPKEGREGRGLDEEVVDGLRDDGGGRGGRQGGHGQHRPAKKNNNLQLKASMHHLDTPDKSWTQDLLPVIW